MSFGKPSSTFSVFKPTPPDRGSFPLDHDGECKAFMEQYLECLSTHGSTSSPCRALSQQYLECRMNRGLMERDTWKNLGFAPPTPVAHSSTAPLPPSDSESLKN